MFWFNVLLVGLTFIAVVVVLFAALGVQAFLGWLEEAEDLNS